MILEVRATLEQDAALTLTVRYYLDNVLIDSFTPAQRLVRGAHALALFYPFPDLEGAASHRWSVRLLCAGGGVKICQRADPCYHHRPGHGGGRCLGRYAGV